MRRKIILAVVIVLVVVGGAIGYLVSRDARQYHLSKGATATIGGIDSTILEESSSEEMAFPGLASGDHIKVIDDSSEDQSDRMRKVAISVESGRYKGLTGKVARMWIRPDHWWQF
jgi:hypothetical protein